MIQNYFKTAFRNLWRHKGPAFVNIIGLGVGMAAFFLIFVYVQFELGFDTFHSKTDRIYRLACDEQASNGTTPGFRTSWPMGTAMKAEFPEVDEVVRLVNPAPFLVQKGNERFLEDHLFVADPSVFSIFDFPLVRGDPATALIEPGSLVISETAAKKYFGTGDAIGQHLKLENGRWTATITGIMKDISENTQIRADMFLSTTPTADDLQRGPPSWLGIGNLTYLLLKPGANAGTLEARFPNFVERHMGTDLRSVNALFILHLESLRKVYLYSHRGGMVTGNINNVRIFSLVAIFILLIACINFINLSTVRATGRAKEVGVRKVAGAMRSQLTGQFIAESVWLSLFAFALAVLLSALTLPFFEQLAGRSGTDNIFKHVSDLGLLFLLAICAGVCAGIYPALVLSGFKAITVLKGKLATGRHGTTLRKGLVVVQFAISIFLIIGTIIIFSQLKYMRNQDLGFKNDQTLVVNTHWSSHQAALKEAIRKIPEVRSASLSFSVPGGNSHFDVNCSVENASGDMQNVSVESGSADEDFVGQYGIKMAAGRSFDKSYTTDSIHAMVINETLLKLLGYTSPDRAIGKKIIHGSDTGKIIGVAREFHFHALQEAVRPFCLQWKGGFQLISIKLDPRNLDGTLAAIEKEYKALIPDWPFDYYFADEYFDRQYRADKRFGSLVFNFSILAIFISCMGLFSLAAYSTFLRTKEIGIRKTMGATTFRIVAILSWDFLLPVLLAFAIAAPVAWLVMSKWLQEYAYRVHMPWWIFVITGVGALSIACITISLHTVRAALANPVKSLRTE